MDGVLNCALTKDRFKGIMGLDERFIKSLDKFVVESNKADETKIVLTYTWRLGKNKDGKDIPEHYEYLRSRLAKHELEIYDETPSIRTNAEADESTRKNLLACLTCPSRQYMPGFQAKRCQL